MMNRGKMRTWLSILLPCYPIWLAVSTPLKNMKVNGKDYPIYEPWSILTIWLMVIPSIIRILIMVIINPYGPLDD